MQNILSGQRMELSNSRPTINPIFREAITFLPSSLPLVKHNFVHYINTFLGSPDPQNRSLGQEAWNNNLKEKEQLESIPITPLSILTLRSHDVIAKLRKALTYEFIADSNRFIQLGLPKGYPKTSHQTKLS